MEARRGGWSRGVVPPPRNDIRKPPLRPTTAWGGSQAARDQPPASSTQPSAQPVPGHTPGCFVFVFTQWRRPLHVCGGSQGTMGGRGCGSASCPTQVGAGGGEEGGPSGASATLQPNAAHTHQLDIVDGHHKVQERHQVGLPGGGVLAGFQHAVPEADAAPGQVSHFWGVLAPQSVPLRPAPECSLCSSRCAGQPGCMLHAWSWLRRGSVCRCCRAPGAPLLWCPGGDVVMGWLSGAWLLCTCSPCARPWMCPSGASCPTASSTCTCWMTALRWVWGYPRVRPHAVCCQRPRVGRPLVRVHVACRLRASRRSPPRAIRDSCK